MRIVVFLILTSIGIQAAPPQKWVAVWAASQQGPYPAGNAVAQPDLRFVFPGNQAQDQTFRLIVKPNLWGERMRLRFSNVFGSQAITFDEIYCGIHAGAGSLLPGTNRPVTFNGGKRNVTLPPGKSLYSDPFNAPPGSSALKLAVSFHVAGSSGPMTWHAKAMTTSYLTRPGGGPHSKESGSDAFPFTTTSWYFLDAVDVMAPESTRAIVAFGDSITDGTNSTINGDDRWPDFLSERLHAAYGSRFSVVNAGIGGNQILAGKPSGLERLDRDILSPSGVATVIWLEGINDLGTSGASAEAVIAGFKEGITRLHARGIRVVGATITSSLNSTATHGTPEVDAKRKAINEFIRHGGAFDAAADFDEATLDVATGTLRPEFQPSSSTGGPGDRLHPNRAGYQAMANSIKLTSLLP